MEINMWAVVGAAVANMVVGSIWYGPLFGKMWMKLAGLTRDSMKDMTMTPMRAMSIALMSSLVTAYVLAHFADVWGALDMQGAWELAFWIWLGFVATTQISSVLWEGKPWRLFFLNAAESLVAYVAMVWVLVRFM